MKKIKNAFTLIELLAVIIILAIVALIATPIILNVIEDAKISAGKSEAQMILGGINNYCATEDVKYQLDNSYAKICTSDMDANDVPTMVNLGNAEITSIKYNGSKLTELVIKSNNHKFTLCPSGKFAMDDEECEVIQTGAIADVVLSNFPYLETNGNGCVTPTDNNYSYMGGCYSKNDSISAKKKFYLLMNQMGIDNDTITTTFFDNDGNFVAENFENFMKEFLISQGATEDQLNQMLQEAGASTLFEYIMLNLVGETMTPEELFAQKEFNNSVWYSGFLWRIMGINADGTIRLITDENVTIIPWGAEDATENWDESYAKDWLNNYFYQKLKGNGIIKEETWCSETATDKNSVRTNCTNNLSKEKAKVGLITLDEYNLAGGINSYLAIGQNQWTMTPYSNSDAWNVDLNGNDGRGDANDVPISLAYGLRAVINVNSNTIITSGNGVLGERWSSQKGPYILNENKNVEITGKLNEKTTSGEYVLFAGKKYRVVDKDSNGNTKLILDGYYEENANIFEMKYNDISTNEFSTAMGIGQKLNGDVLNWLTNNNDTEKGKLVSNYTWYQNNFDRGYDYKISLNEENPTRSITATVGLIRIGEVLSSQSSSIFTKGYTMPPSNYSNTNEFWTMTPSTNSYNVWYVNNFGGVSSSSVPISYGLRPVIVINSDVIITGGNGTWSNPYQI